MSPRMVLKGAVLLPGDVTMVSLNWKWSLPPGHFVGSDVNPYTKGGITIEPGVVL